MKANFIISRNNPIIQG